MDDLTSKVGNIETALHESRRQLQTLDKNAQAPIGQEVDGMQNALTNGDGKIQYVSSEVQSFLSQIEHNDTDTSLIDLKPQLKWLSTNLGEIISELKMAQSQAGTAMNYTNDYTYKVMDVGQEVEISRSKLIEARRDGEFLTSEAQSELSNSQRQLAATQSEIAAKEREIRTKTNEANAKRERRQELNSEISRINREISEATRAREKKEDIAAVGAGLGFFGILLAPVSFGASLGLTAAGAGVFGVNAVDISDLKDEIREANTSISRLQSDIDQADRDVSTLERQKGELQQLVKQYQSEVDTCKTKHQEYLGQIQKISLIQSEISLLQDHASSTNSNVTKIHRELQQIKQKLDTCSALLREKFEDVQTSSGFIERSLGKQHQRKQDFKRQKFLMQNIPNALDRSHSEVSALLQSHDTKFLDAKPCNAGTHTVVDVGLPIPRFCYHT